MVSQKGSTTAARVRPRFRFCFQHLDLGPKPQDRRTVRAQPFDLRCRRLHGGEPLILGLELNELATLFAEQRNLGAQRLRRSVRTNFAAV